MFFFSFSTLPEASLHNLEYFTKVRASELKRPYLHVKTSVMQQFVAGIY